MNDPNKKVHNTLFNAAVTGGTFEEFSQHALLLPAKEKPPPPVLSVPQDQTQNSSQFLEATNNASFESFTNQVDYSQQQQQNNYQPQPFGNLAAPPVQEIDLQPKQSNFSSIFSPFSSISGAFSIIKGGGTQVPEEEVSIPPPAGIESLISQENPNVQPVPLFPAVATNISLSKQPVNTGSVNTFRRATGLKRPTYAQIPDLVSSGQPPQVQQAFPPQNHLPPQLPPQPSNFLQPQPPPSVSPADSLNSNQDTSTPYQFKPIAPIPSIPSPISQPLPTQKFSHLGHSQVSQPLFVSQTNTHIPNSFSSPVMSAIPVNEVLPSNLNMEAQSGFGKSNENFAGTTSTGNQVYRPVYNHWFHKKEVEGKTIWKPFSMSDSLALEEAFTSNDLDPDKFIPTEGGRFDVNILRRQRQPVYWEGTPSEVRRCSWFHKSHSDGRFIPYEENVANKLEEEFKIAFERNQWHKTVELANGENVVFHGPDVLVLFPPAPAPDAWGNTQNQARARLVKRGMDEFDIDEGEPPTVDHLLFMVHGIGAACDFKFRSVEEVVDEFRSIALQLVQSHYRSSCDNGVVHKIEVLPISWHDKLHSEETGIDKLLKSITLDSIPKLRDFTNDTLLDIFFYTSPIYCQTIISTVGNELNRIYNLFKQRNPSFSGNVSLGGHSLGSLILFDLLGHQKTPEPDLPEEVVTGDEDVLAPLPSKPSPDKRKMSRRISYMMSSIGTGQPQIQYPQLDFHPSAFFALGSPIGMFVTVRGLDKLGIQYSLPTCPAFFNIFHPYDPVAYRIESLVNPDLSTLKPVLIPHHKGRKRMHLELKETLATVGADLKQKVVDSMKSTWNSFYQLAMFHRADQPPSLEEEVNKAFQEQLNVSEPLIEEISQEPTQLPLGQLNKGRRIDYVLQEAPFEFINEYIFALTSHVCYWESEDTILMMLKEIYSSIGVTTDNQIPQQTMTIERPPSSPRSSPKTQNPQFGMDPTAPIQSTSNLGPPPTAGFLKKT